jgi:hypothetical protein
VSRRALPILLGLVLVALVVATLATGEAIYVVPAALLVAVIAAMALGELGLKKRLEHRHDGDMDAAMADSEDPVPSTHLVADDDTPLGDTKEAHDEVSPHDLPKDHPGRIAAEKQAGERYDRGDAGVTRGSR